jgi:U4/U6 small nuclear ribonucleoprotein SNU13
LAKRCAGSSQPGWELDVCCAVQLSNTILDIVQQAVNFQQLKKGANEGVVRRRTLC